MGVSYYMDPSRARDAEARWRDGGISLGEGIRVLTANSFSFSLRPR